MSWLPRLLCTRCLWARPLISTVPSKPFALQSLNGQQGLIGVAYSDPPTGYYLGSPSILQLPGGTLLASHDTFRGWPNWTLEGGPITYVYKSLDGGSSWAAVGQAPGQYWSTLFRVGGTPMPSLARTSLRAALIRTVGIAVS